MTKLQQLMREIVKSGPISKKELQERTGISWGMVSSLINQLVEQKLIASGLRETRDVGRKAEEFDVNPGEHFCIGIDLSYNGLLGVVTDLKGRVVMQAEHIFEVREKSAVLEAIFQTVEGFLEACKGKKVWGIGFAVQGIVEIYEGVSVLISAINGWRNVPLKAILEERYGLPVFTEHDPNCVMLAERAVGCLKDRQVQEATLLCFNPKVGAGISVLTRGQITHGVRGRAGEIGCNPVNITPEGRWNHFEDHLTKQALLEAYEARAGKAVTYPEFTALLQQGEAHCVDIYRQLGRYFGFSLAVANNYLNPACIILNIAGHQQILFEEISRLVRAVSFDPEVELLLSESRPETKAVGAALILSGKALSSL